MGICSKKREVPQVCDVSLHLKADMCIKISAWQYATFL